MNLSLIFKSVNHNMKPFTIFRLQEQVQRELPLWLIIVMKVYSGCNLKHLLLIPKLTEIKRYFQTPNISTSIIFLKTLEATGSEWKLVITAALCYLFPDFHSFPGFLYLWWFFFVKLPSDFRNIPDSALWYTKVSSHVLSNRPLETNIIFEAVKCK